MTIEQIDELVEAFGIADRDDDVGAVIVTGADARSAPAPISSAGANTFDATTNPARKERDAAARSRA